MESPASDDEAASEVLSHYSSASESASIAEEVTGEWRQKMVSKTWLFYILKKP